MAPENSGARQPSWQTRGRRPQARAIRPEAADDEMERANRAPGGAVARPSAATVPDMLVLGLTGERPPPFARLHRGYALRPAAASTRARGVMRNHPGRVRRRARARANLSASYEAHRRASARRGCRPALHRAGRERLRRQLEARRVRQARHTQEVGRQSPQRQPHKQRVGGGALAPTTCSRRRPRSPARPAISSNRRSTR